MPGRSRLAAAATAAVTAVAVLAASAAPAFAHVSIAPREVATGGAAELRLRVPNERDDAATVAVELVFPDGHQLRDVTAPAPAGWTSSTDGDPVVDRIRWDATAGGLSGDEAVELPVRIGAVHGDGDGEQLVFRSLQTYSDGEVVRWIEAPQPGGEPEHPAPVLTVTGPADPAPATEQPGDDPVIGEPDVPTATAEDALDAPGATGGDGDGSGRPPVLLLLLLFAVSAVATAAVVLARGRRRSG